MRSGEKYLNRIVMRNIHKIIGGIVSIIICLLCNEDHAQNNPGGVYLSATDYDSQQVGYPVANGNAYHLKTNDVFYKPYITLRIGNTIIHFQKSKIFGYRDKHHTSYRFFNKHIYTILNPNRDILLYKTTVLAGKKGVQTRDLYFFSKDAYTNILPLTLANVQSVFIKDTLFIRQLSVSILNDDDLIQYDKQDSTYRINEIYRAGRQSVIKNKQ